MSKMDVGMAIINLQTMGKISMWIYISAYHGNVDGHYCQKLCRSELCEFLATESAIVAACRYTSDDGRERKLNIRVLDQNKMRFYTYMAATVTRSD